MPYPQGAAEEYTAAKDAARDTWLNAKAARHAVYFEEVDLQRVNYAYTLAELRSEYKVAKLIDKETYMAGKRTAAGIFVAAKKQLKDTYKAEVKECSLAYAVAKNAARAAYKAQFFRA